MGYRSSKRKIIFGGVFLILLVMSLGYAYLSGLLNINGNATIKNNSWIIYFDNVVEKNGVAASTPAVIIDEAKTKINFAVDLNDAGDKYEFVVDIKNDGTLDAMIDDVIKSGITNANSSYLDFTVTYLDGTPIKKCDLLKAQSQRKIKVITQFKKYYNDVSELPNSTSTIDLGFEIDYIQAGKTCEVDDEEIEPTPPPEKHTLTIDPNGGVYAKGTESETNENFELTLEPGEEYTLHRFSRDGFELVLDLSEIIEYDETTRVITMADRDILIKPEWNLVDLTDVVAKNIDTGKYYPTINSAFIEARNNETIELLKDTEEDPVNNTNGTITLDLGGYKVTGTLTNNKTLTLLNGTVENLDGIGAINNGTLTLGKNDGTVLVDEEGTIALIGSSTEGIGLQNNGTFNFYDGYLEAKVGLTGGYDNIPEEWYVYVNHNDVKNCQKVHLTQDVSRAVAKTVFEGVATRYFNLQDAFNSGMEEDLDVYAIRDFEAPYELHIDENEELLFDLAGFVVNTGNSITNSGTFTMTDTGRTAIVEGEEQTIKGELKPSKSITNNGTLNITNAKITSTSDANVIVNNGIVNLNKIVITSLDGYAIYNTGSGSVNGKYDNVINSNNYAIYNDSDLTLDVNLNFNANGMIYNLGNVVINDGLLEFVARVNNTRAIYNDGSSKNVSLEINGGKIAITGEQYDMTAIYQSSIAGATTIINDGEIEVKNTKRYSGAYAISGIGLYQSPLYGNVTMTGGSVKVESYQAYGVYGSNIQMSGGTVTVLAEAAAYGIVNYEGGNTAGDRNGVSKITGGKVIATSATDTNNSNVLIAKGFVGRGTVENLEITSSHTCVYTYGSTIKSGEYDCGTYGIYNYSGISSITGTEVVSDDIGIYNDRNGSITMSGGSVKSNNSYGVYQNASKIDIGYADELDIQSIEGKTTGIYVNAGTCNVEKANIVGKTEYGIYAKAPINLGKDDENVSITYPSVRGNSYGVYNDGTTFNFYDGILKGQTDGMYGEISGTPNGYSNEAGTENIEGDNYKTIYLNRYRNFAKVGTVEFNSLKDAVDSIEEEGTIDLIASAEIKSDVTIPEGKNIKLNIDGYTLELSKKIINNGTLLIENDNSNGGFSCSVEDCIYNNGDIVIDGGTYTSDRELIRNVGSMRIDSGLFEVNSSSTGTTYAIFNDGDSKNVSLEINGGKITLTGEQYDMTAIYQSSRIGASTTINAGEIEVKNTYIYGSAYATSGIGYYQSPLYGNVTMTGGSVKVESYNAYGIYCDNIQMSGGTVTVLGENVSYGIVNYEGGSLGDNSGVSKITGGRVIVTSTEDSSNQLVAKGFIGTGTVENLEITSSHTCVYTYGSTIKSGEYDCGTYGIYNYSGTSSITGTEVVSDDIGIYNDRNGSVTLAGGSVKSNNSYGVYQNASKIDIGYADELDIQSIEGKTTGIYINAGTCNVEKANIVGKTEYGIYAKAPINLGKDDENVSITYPSVRGNSYGVYNDGTTFNFYDGIIKSLEEDVVYGAISGFPDGYSNVKGTESIDSTNYNTMYLTPYVNYAKVGEVEYNSLNKAIAAIENDGTIDLIASADIKSDVTIPEGKNIKLNLAGYTLELSKKIINDGTLLIENDNSNGGFSCSVEDCIYNNGNMVIDGGTYTSDRELIRNAGSMRIDSGTFEINSSSTETTYGIYNDGESKNVSLEINGGKITLTGEQYDMTAIYQSSQTGASTTINAGEIEVKNTYRYGTAYALAGIGYYQSPLYGSVTMTGGSVKVESYNAYGIYCDNIQMSGGTVTVLGEDVAIGIDNYEGGSLGDNSGVSKITGGKVIVTSAEDSSNKIIAKGFIGTGTIENLEITSSHTCVYTYGSTIKSGEYECGTYGIYNYNGTTTISGMNTVSEDIGLYMDRWGTVNLTGGTIKSNTSYGAYVTALSTLNLGAQGGGIDAGNPTLIGSSYGVYIESGESNFYDGIIKGKTEAIYGSFTNVEENAFIKDETETIGEETYKDKYLIYQTDVIKNNNKLENNTYNNIVTAINDATSGDELELIADASIYYELTVPSDKTINLDMKGYSIVTSKEIVNNGTLNISNSNNEKKSKISCSLDINLFTNKGVSSISNVDIKYGSTAVDKYPIINEGTLTLSSVDVSYGVYGIYNKALAVLTMNNSNVNASSTAISNYGELSINGGRIEGKSYAIYNNTSVDNEINNAVIVSNSVAIYKYNNSSITTMEDNSITGSINNNVGTISVLRGSINGVIVNNGVMTLNNNQISKTFTDGRYCDGTDIEIKNTSDLTIDNVTIETNHNDCRNLRVIDSSGNISVTDSTITAQKATYFVQNSSVGIYNSNIASLEGNSITMGDDSETSSYTNNVQSYGIINTENGVLTSDEDTIIVNKGNNSYGVYNNSTSLTNVVNHPTIRMNGESNSYGIYTVDGTIVTETGTIDVNANNAYGIYIDGNDAVLTLGTLDGRGIKTVDMSTTDPEIKAIGSTLGVGVKSVNGDFNFYDGRLIGSTYAKPETANLVETKFEARYFLVHDDDTETEIPFGDEAGRTYKYEYCILEFLE